MIQQIKKIRLRGNMTKSITIIITTIQRATKFITPMKMKTMTH